MYCFLSWNKRSAFLATKKIRKLKETTRQLVWGMSGGRCEKAGCNRLLYESSITHTSLNEGQIAHIIPVSDNGPRGEFFSIGDRDEAENLMLLCAQCHKEIDSRPDLYPANSLKRMKQEHEERIRYLTSITRDRECLTVIYFASIEKDFTCKNTVAEIQQALADIQHYSSYEHQLDISTNFEGVKDGESMKEKALSLERLFEQRVKPFINQEKLPIAVFALAPIPLLIKLGTMFPTGTRLMPFLKLRCFHHGGSSWQYDLDQDNACPFLIINPRQTHPENGIGLVLETTDFIDQNRIDEVVKNEGSLDFWRVRHKYPSYDLICSEAVINYWVKVIMQVMNTIRMVYGQKPVHVFPSINNAFAIMVGVARVAKTDSEWIIYDNVRISDSKSRFVPSLSIGGNT